MSLQLDQQQITAYAQSIYVYGDDYSAQSFQAGLSGYLAKVILMMYKAGTPVNLVIEIQGVDGSGHPDGNVLASEEILESAIGTSPAELEIIFSTPIQITNGSNYSIVVKQKNNGGDSLNKYYSRGCIHSNYYVNGKWSYTTDGGGYWQDFSNGDLYFKTYVEVGPPTINSDAKIIISREQYTIDSDSDILGRIQKLLDSDSIIKQVIIETVNSDSKIVLTSQESILSTAEIFNTTHHILSDAKIKTTNISEIIYSDSKLIIQLQKDINSDTELISPTHTETINSDTYLLSRIEKTIDSDSSVKQRVWKYIDSDINIWYHKDFYSKLRAQLSNKKDFYAQLKVNQLTPVDPTGLTATDNQTGESILLDWTNPISDNFGYNVYKDVGGDWIKQNETLIKDNFYVVGGLTTGVTYTFKVVGVNGIGDESIGVIISGDTYPQDTTPSYNIERYKEPKFEILINGSKQEDAVLERVELMYGPSFSTVSFYIPKNPSDESLPQASRQKVEVKINNRLVFTGKLIKRTNSYDSQNLRASYTSLNSLWDETLYTVGSYAACPFGYPIDLWDPMQVAEMTKLDYRQFCLRYMGNYKIYCSPIGEISYYKISSPISIRTYEVGKHILRQDISKDWSNPPHQDIVYSDFGRVTTSTRGHYGLNSIRANEISNVQVFAKINQKPQVTSYLSGPEVLPCHIKEIHERPKFTSPSFVTKELDESWEEYNQRVKDAEIGWLKDHWGDGGSEGRYPIKSYQTFSKEWKSVSAKIEYAEDGNSAKIIITPSPKVWHTNIQSGTYEFIKMVDDEPKKEEVEVSIWNEPYWAQASIFIIYTYKSNRLSASAGSGISTRTHYEGIVPIYISVPSGVPYQYLSQSNISEVFNYISNRAQGESARSQPIDRGTMSILGDETLDLRTKVNGLEVVRITHDFSNGFLTHLDLTSESFYSGVATYNRKELITRKSKEDTNKGNIIIISYDMEKIKAIIGEQKPDQGIDPKAGIAYYSD